MSDFDFSIICGDCEEEVFGGTINPETFEFESLKAMLDNHICDPEEYGDDN